MPRSREPQPILPDAIPVIIAGIGIIPRLLRRVERRLVRPLGSGIRAVVMLPVALVGAA